VNLVALLNTIQIDLSVIFVSLEVFVHPSIQAVNVHCRFADSYVPCITSLSESKLGSLECSRVPWNAVECLGMQLSAIKSIMIILYESNLCGTNVTNWPSAC
jgi:hypothetical protein